MSAYVVTGKNRLYGSVRVHGAKNSVLPILAATILVRGESVIGDCPTLRDVEYTKKILRGLGCLVEGGEGKLRVIADGMDSDAIPDSLMREMRSSVIFLGAILARTGRAEMSFPGGCELGPRPIDLHLAALRELGAEVTETGGKLICAADKLRGATVNLTFPSVGATENIMLAATAAEGTTRIHNPAREPEIVDLQNFLCAMGARVRGAGGSVIEIEGGVPLRGTEYNVLPDRIVTATYLAAVAAAGGAVTVENARPCQLSAVMAVLREAGCEISEREDKIHIVREHGLKSVRPIRTMPYPGFPTDAQSIIMSAMAMAEGTTVFVENIFENRFRHAGELARMGADIRVEGKVAVVSGVTSLHGAQVESTDLRGGAGLVVAALGAEGQTVVTGLSHIERGYDGLAAALCSVGSDIKTIN